MSDESLTVVGIVGDAPEDRLTNPPELKIYLAFEQAPQSYTHVVVRSHGTDPLALAPVIRNTLRQVDANVLGRDFQTLEQVVGDSVARERFLTALLVLFASAALLLASIGVFGLLSFTVAERTREIGVRIALGAVRREIMTMVLRDALKLAAVGLAIGVHRRATDRPTARGVALRGAPDGPRHDRGHDRPAHLRGPLGELASRSAGRAGDPMTVLRHE